MEVLGSNPCLGKAMVYSLLLGECHDSFKIGHDHFIISLFQSTINIIQSFIGRPVFLSRIELRPPIPLSVHLSDMKFEVLTVAKLSMLVFWVVKQYGLVGKYRRFGEHTASIFRVEDGGSIFPRNVGIYLQVYTMLQPRRPTSISP
jgi:hypothetical protein